MIPFCKSRGARHDGKDITAFPAHTRKRSLWYNLSVDVDDTLRSRNREGETYPLVWSRINVSRSSTIKPAIRGTITNIELKSLYSRRIFAEKPEAWSPQVGSWWFGRIRGSHNQNTCPVGYGVHLHPEKGAELVAL